MKRMSKSMFFLYFFMLFFLRCNAEQQYNIGLLIVATNKYTKFVSPLLESADKYFCKNHNVTYFLFTDDTTIKKDNLVTIYQKHLGWPLASLLRCYVYFLHKELFRNMDYLFACDVDMIFVDDVGDEILSDSVATQHSAFVNERGWYEMRSFSTAYVKKNEGTHYFAGGFYGGGTKEFLKISYTMMENIKVDLSKNFIALWHDESHLNRYFIDNPPTKILSPSYCYPATSNLNYHKRLLSLDRDQESEKQTLFTMFKKPLSIKNPNNNILD